SSEVPRPIEPVGLTQAAGGVPISTVDKPNDLDTIQMKPRDAADTNGPDFAPAAAGLPRTPSFFCVALVEIIAAMIVAAAPRSAIKCDSSISTHRTWLANLRPY